MIDSLKHKYFLKKPWTIELVNKESYERWKKKNSEYNITYREYIKIWNKIVDEIIKTVVYDTNGLELPLYLGTLSVKKIDKEYRCEKDMPKVFRLNEYKIKESVPLPNMSSTFCKIVWKKNRRNKNIPSLLAMEASSVMKKKVFKRIKNEGTGKFQLAQQTEPIPSKCEPIQEKSLFDIV